MQNKGKAVKTAIIIVLVLVVLAGAVGVTTVLLNRNNAEGNEPLKVEVNNFKFGYTGSGSYSLGFFVGYPLIKKSIQESGYCDVLIELNNLEDPTTVLTWKLRWNGLSPSGEMSDYYSITVDEKDSTKAKLRIKQIAGIDYDLHIDIRASETEYSTISLTLYDLPDNYIVA